MKFFSASKLSFSPSTPATILPDFTSLQISFFLHSYSSTHYTSTLFFCTQMPLMVIACSHVPILHTCPHLEHGHPHGESTIIESDPPKLLTVPAHLMVCWDNCVDIPCQILIMCIFRKPLIWAMYLGITCILTVIIGTSQSVQQHVLHHLIYILIDWPPLANNCWWEKVCSVLCYPKVVIVKGFWTHTGCG